MQTTSHGIALTATQESSTLRHLAQSMNAWPSRRPPPRLPAVLLFPDDAAPSLAITDKKTPEDVAADWEK